MLELATVQTPPLYLALLMLMLMLMLMHQLMLMLMLMHAASCLRGTGGKSSMARDSCLMP